MQQLRGLVREQCAAKPKCLHGAALSGSMLGAMLTSYVQAINRGAVPCVASAWEAVKLAHEERLLKDSIANFQRAMAPLHAVGALPARPALLRSWLTLPRPTAAPTATSSAYV